MNEKYQSIIDFIQDFHNDHVEINEIKKIDLMLDSNFSETGLDSLSAAELDLLAEEEFGIILEASDFINIDRTIGAYARVICNKIGEKAVEINNPDSSDLNSATHDYVFLHALGTNSTSAGKLEHCLGEQVHTFDFPGYGQRNLESSEITTIDDSVEILRRELEERGIENPVLIGHSYGGMVALAYALKNPVNKVILVNSSPRKVLDLDIEDHLDKTRQRFEGGSIDYSEVNWCHDQRFILVGMKTTQPETSASYWRGVAEYDLTDCLDQVTCPVLVIAGERDSLIAREFTEEYRKMPNVIIEYVKGGHYLPLTNAQELADIIRGDSNE
jgi:pimeloyl-ACP methyl ester carboxylesterase/acyl carrier protein